MARFPFVQVDAFTDRPLGGNPCAVVFDADPLDDATMQAVAQEMNLSETAFVLRSQIADVGARYFTPGEEIPFAGHPTVATVFALAEAGRIALRGDRTDLRLELPVGPIPIEIHAQGGRVAQVMMSQKRPEFLAEHAPESVLPVFGLAPEDALPGAPILTVSTGTPQLMVPVASLEALRRACLDAPAYGKLRADKGFFSAHLFCTVGVTSAGRTFARHFGVPPYWVEDPVTGSASGAMGAYLWRHELIEEPAFTAEQGHWMNRPGAVRVEVVGPPDAIETVRVGGAAVTIVRGELVL